MHPHEKRCATCAFYEDGKYYDYCEGEQMRPIGVYGWIVKKGCASWQPKEQL